MSILSELRAKEIGLGIAVLVLLALLANPFEMYMLSMAAMTILALLLVAVFAFVALLWGEMKATDEREEAHQAFVGRVAYLVGACALTIAIVVETLRHDLDIALVIVLGIMVLSKLLGNAYARARH